MSSPETWRKFRSEKLQAPLAGPENPFAALSPNPQLCNFLDLGAGNGRFAVAQAKSHPQAQVYAVDRSKVRFARMMGRHARHGLANFYPIRADVSHWAAFRLGQASVDRIYFMYPNPEPGRPNRRWSQAPVSERLWQSLKPGGRVVFATNVEQYVGEFVECWQNRFAIQSSVIDVARFSGPGRSAFERKYLERSNACFEVNIIKEE